MIKKVFLSLLILIISLISLIVLFFYLGGIPVGFNKGHLIVLKTYLPDDFSGRSETAKFYSRVHNQEECKKLDGIPTLGGIGIYIGCRVK